MKHLTFVPLLLGLSAAPAFAQDSCPWAGGEYSFRDHGIYGDFVVNADCTELVWSRIADSDENTAMERTNDGWKGSLSKADFVLLENGRNLRITGVGGATHNSNAKRTN